jgi:formyl-CoA transferase
MNQLPLSGIKVIDFTSVQSGRACTQMMAWFGADVIKVERITGGDVKRHQLHDIPDVDALYFTMLSSNKRSRAINTKTKAGSPTRPSTRRSTSCASTRFPVRPCFP